MNESTQDLKATRLSNAILLRLCLAGLLIVGCLLAVMMHMRTSMVEEAGVTTGRSMANQVVTLRSFYTSEIVARAKKAGMNIGFDYAEKDATLPLPATLVKALGETIAKDYPGSELRLLSNHPFPNRANGRQLDAFQTQALAALEKDPKTPVHRVEEINGRLSVRYAVADVMKEGCVACHNSHPQSPKTDWKVGDVRGMIEVVAPVDEVDKGINQASMMIGVLMLTGFGLIGLLIHVLMRRYVADPLKQAVNVMESAANGDLTVQAPQGRRDEVGSLFTALNDMVDKLRHTVGQVRASAHSLQHVTAEVANGNADLSQRTEETSANLQNTASSMTQLTATVERSAQSAATANQLACSAAEVAQRGGMMVSQVVDTMDEIHASSRKIADIIGVIDGIAFQTNILALNAAVEAARAGDEGRGFAVVASEVRSLAQRSAEAAREIKALISTSVDKVENGARLVQDAGTTMDELVASVNRVTGMIGEISAASHEQAGGLSQVNGAIGQLDQMTQQNAALVEQSAAAAESLQDQATKLADVVSTFRLDKV
jgi:methyl-accepting chemotaxis protein